MGVIDNIAVKIRLWRISPQWKSIQKKFEKEKRMEANYGKAN